LSRLNPTLKFSKRAKFAPKPPPRFFKFFHHGLSRLNPNLVLLGLLTSSHFVAHNLWLTVGNPKMVENKVVFGGLFVWALGPGCCEWRAAAPESRVPPPAVCRPCNSWTPLWKRRTFKVASELALNHLWWRGISWMSRSWRVRDKPERRGFSSGAAAAHRSQSARVHTDSFPFFPFFPSFFLADQTFTRIFPLFPSSFFFWLEILTWNVRFHVRFSEKNSCPVSRNDGERRLDRCRREGVMGRGWWRRMLSRSYRRSPWVMSTVCGELQVANCASGFEWVVVDV